MAKQIYIDENGNEILLSGTVNSADILPITTGSGTNTKAYVDSKLNETVTFTASEGVTASAHMKKINGTVVLSLNFMATVTVNTWKTIGSLSVAPSQTVYACAVYTQDGNYAGMIQIRSDKGIYYYAKINTSASTVGFTACFVVA